MSGPTWIICWRRLDRPGHEAAELRGAGSEWRLHGVAVVAGDTGPRALEYAIECDASWRTCRATVASLVGGDSPGVDLVRSPGGDWTVNGSPRTDLAGCVDVDLGFSPSTNLLPIRRLRLAVGAQAAVRAAWVRFPELTVEVLEQRYHRTGVDAYRYESAGGAFMRDLVVDDTGFVVDYPGLWRVEART